MTLNATAAATDANSYATVAFADSYHEGRLYADVWTQANATKKAAALVQATTMIDAFFSTHPRAWEGSPTTTTQALCFPRTGLTLRNGNLVDSATIPTDLAKAASELARQLLSSDLSADNAVANQGITSLSAGPVSLSFKQEIASKPIPDAVLQLVPSHWYSDIVRDGKPIIFEVL